MAPASGLLSASPNSKRAGLGSEARLQGVSIAPGESQILDFRFQVPGTVANGAFICTRAFVGQAPTPAFNTVADRFLFCISKGVTGFTLVPENTARQMMLQRSGGKTWAQKR